jgi:ATP-binding cassette subfamily B protein
MASKNFDLSKIAWPASRLGELIENLARKSKLISRPGKLPQPPKSTFNSDLQAMGRWIDTASGYLGLEAEPVDMLYGGVEQLIRVGGPAILRLPKSSEGNEPHLVGLLKGSSRRCTILCPDLKVRSYGIETIRSAICSPYEEHLKEEVDQLLTDAGVPEQRRQRARTAILREQLGQVRLDAGWLLRLSPGTNLNRQFRTLGVYRPVFILLTMFLFQQLLAIASWIVIGRGIFQGHFDLAWLFAWVILLLSTIPVQLIVNDAQSELSMNAGTIFKQRLMYGTLNLEPEEIRHQGMGQFLGRVMESEAVEMLALSGGFNALLSIIELILAMVILSRGAGGNLHALMLAVWVLFTLVIFWQYFRISRAWAEAYREMTNDLAENMVGHRTRLAQQEASSWHTEEDQSLERYLELSEDMDRIGIVLNAVTTRGWIIVGVAGIAIPFISGSPSTQSLAISLGGVLLASQALNMLASGSQSLINLLNAWQQVGPLFNAANRPREIPPPGFAGIPTDRSSPTGEFRDNLTDRTNGHLVIQAKDLVFRYVKSGKPVIEDCSLQVESGERLLLEGPSGGGKSTLAALLTGLRSPDSGSLLLLGFDRKILGGEEWRRRVVMAPQFQENYVFSETFAFNLLMGRRWPPLPEDLEEAELVCRELGLGEVLDRMPSGLQQMLGENGWQLSHGERSRLYIARTLLQKAEMIILDESFGALDPENLNRSLRCVLERAPTLLVIAHP